MFGGTPILDGVKDVAAAAAEETRLFCEQFAAEKAKRLAEEKEAAEALGEEGTAEQAVVTNDTGKRRNKASIATTVAQTNESPVLPKGAFDGGGTGISTPLKPLQTDPKTGQVKFDFSAPVRTAGAAEDTSASSATTFTFGTPSAGASVPTSPADKGGGSSPTKPGRRKMIRAKRPPAAATKAATR